MVRLLLATGGSAAVAQVGILALTVLTLLLLIDSDVHEARRRVCGRDADVGDGRAADRGGAGSAGDLCRAGAAEPGALYSDCVCEEVGQERRSGDEVLPVRRHVGGVSAVRVQLSLRDYRFDESARDDAGRCICSHAVGGCAAALCGAGDDRGRTGLQGGGGAVSLVGAGYV